MLPKLLLEQSYPENFPSENNPKTGYSLKNLPKKCESSNLGGKTTLYKLKGTLNIGNAVVVRFYDELLST